MSPSPFRIVFCGTPAFAVPSLQALAADPAYKVELVITQPDKPIGRKQVITPTPVKVAALELGIPVEQPDNINDFRIPLSGFDFLVVVAYGQLFKQPLLDLPSIAAVNLHGSLLPRWRGASPIHHSVLAGDTESGVSVQKMVKKLDAGPVLNQTSITLDPRETSTTLLERLAILGAQLLVKTLQQPLNPQPQDETKVTICRKLTRKDGEVDSEIMTAEEIDRHVRALVPWPGVTCTINGKSVKLLATDLQSSADAFPLPCKNNTILYITKIQSPGKEAVKGAEWIRGNPL